MAKKMSLNKFIKILTEIRDKYNAGDFAVTNSKFTEYNDHWISDLINLDRKDIIVNDEEKFIGIDAHMRFKDSTTFPKH